MEPRRTTVTPELDRWRRQAERDARRTAVVRLRGGTDPDRAATRLAAFGMDVESSGAGTVIGAVTPAVLDRLGGEPWVLAVEAPRGLRPLGG